MRVLVVDDSVFMRRAITEMINSDPGLRVIDQAKNGEEAIEKAKRLLPDVITLDIEMPVMDGLTALRRIRRECVSKRPAVLVCSSLTKDGSHEALKAMCAGAADVIAKDASQYSTKVGQMREELIAKIKAIGAANGSRTPRIRIPAAPVPGGASAAKPPALRAASYDAVLIGSSTGGPPVLELVLSAIPANLSMPVIVAQHMPPVFTRSLAERVDMLSMLTVVEAENGMPLYPGVAYILPGGKHGRLRGTGKQLRIEISDEPRTALYRPSVNELFASGARTLGGRCLAIVMTGMGEDGKLGAEQIKAAGGTILAQSGDTCVVYGMPRAVVDAGLTTAALSPLQIAQTLVALAGGAAAPRDAAA